MKVSYGLIALGLICCAYSIWIVVVRGIVVVPFTRDMFLISAAPLIVGVALEVIDRARRH